VSGLGFLLIVVALAFLWLALVRPQKRRQQAQTEMWETLEKGDEIVTAGGIYGEVTGFQGDDVLVRIAPQLEVRVARRAIAGVIPPEEPAEASIEDAESYSEESH
jgi:preprotein translocase subunit YajC